MTPYLSMSAIVRMVTLSLFSVFFFISDAQYQFPEAISILPDSAAGFGEITLILDPAKTCVPDGYERISGQDSILFSSSAVLLYEDERSWDHRVGSKYPSQDGTLPYLYPYNDSLYSITYTPRAYYGTGTELIKGISARFRREGAYGLDFGEEGCQDFYIPFELDTVELSLNVDLSHQIFLGYFDPLFDHVDAIGNFNNWGNPQGTDLEDPDGDSIYSVTLTDMVVDQTIEYRFRRNKSDETSESLAAPGYRTYLVRDGENNLMDWYNDLEPALASLSVNATSPVLNTLPIS